MAGESRILNLEKLHKLSQSLSELGIEWSLGPLVLLQVVRGGSPKGIDIAVCLQDASDNIADTCSKLGVASVFWTINRGFTSRCIYVWGLPCISVEDVVLSCWHELNRPYLSIVRELLLGVSLDLLDWNYVRNVALRLGILDKVRDFLAKLGLNISRDMLLV